MAPSDPEIVRALHEDLTIDTTTTRRHVVESAVAAWYLTPVDLAEMVDRAPMVEVVFTDPG